MENLDDTLNRAKRLFTGAEARRAKVENLPEGQLPPDAVPGVVISPSKAEITGQVYQSLTLDVTIVNRSEFLLNSSGPYPIRLAYHWIDAFTGNCVIFDGQRTSLGSPIAQGETRNLVAEVVCPTRPGKFILQLSLVQEHTFWFNEVFSAHGRDVPANIVARDIWKAGSRKIANAEENTFWSEYGYHHSEITLRNRPAIFSIEGTNYCNIKCVMCPRGEPDIMTRQLGHMSTDLLERIVDQAGFFTDPAWLHWFGEPLMNPKIWEQIAIAKRKVPNLGISTNATLLTIANIDNLLGSDIDTVIIALDGASKAVYEQTRKSARFTFEQVRANVEEFLSRKSLLRRRTPFVHLSIIVMEETQQDLEQFTRYWVARGADFYHVQTIRQLGWPGSRVQQPCYGGRSGNAQDTQKTSVQDPVA